MSRPARIAGSRCGSPSSARRYSRVGRLAWRPVWAGGAGVIGLAIALLAAGTPSAALAAAAHGGFSARPLAPGGTPAQRSYFHWRLGPGGHQAGVLLVTNSGETAVELRAYPVDAVTGTTSGAVYTTAGTVLRGAGTWLSTAADVLTVPAHAQRTLRFTAQVPATAVPGDHLAAIALESTDRPRMVHGAVAIVEVLRIAVAVLVRVSGPASDGLRAGSLALRSLPGTNIASVVVGLRNVGQLICGPRLSVTLDGRRRVAQAVTRRLDVILPGDAIDYPLPWPASLGTGRYSAVATLTGCGPRTSLQESVTLARTLRGFASPAPARVMPHGSFPWWLFALVAVGTGAGGTLLGWASSRRRGSPTPIEPHA